MLACRFLLSVEVITRLFFDYHVFVKVYEFEAGATVPNRRPGRQREWNARGMLGAAQARAKS
jgi:hypothetical protein